MKNKFALKIALTLFAFLLILSSLTACNNSGEGENTPTDAPTDSSATEGNTEPSKYSGNSIGESEFIIFDNGSYTCPIIVSENATDAEKKIYNKLRDKLKSLTGTLVEFKTDFKAYNDTGNDRSAPAVLIGRTNYDESAEIYKELRFSEGKIVVKGNKLIIAFSDESDGNDMYSELLKLIANSGEKRVALDLSVNLSKISNPELSELPACTKGVAFAIDCDDDTDMIRVEEAGYDAFVDYKERLKADGYESLVAREAGGNLFETFIKGDRYVHIYYKLYNDVMRAVVGDVSALPDYEEMAKSFEKVTTPSLTLVGQSYSDIGLGMIYKLYDGRFVVIDGGANYGKDLVYKQLSKLAGEGNDIVVAAWFLTHAHGDHQSGFEELVEKHPEDVTIENLVYNFAPESKYKEIAGEENNDLMNDMRELVKTKLAGKTRIIKAHTGQLLSFGGIEFEILYTPEDFYPAKFDYLNLTSLIVRANIDGTTVLSLADATHTLGTVLVNSYGDYLKSDMVQLAHHGIWASIEKIYEVVDADVLIWPSNSNGAKQWIEDSSVRAAIKPAKDIYLPGASNITIEFPYVFKNNKAEFISNHT